MFCYKCGGQNPDGSSFCAHCGTRLIEPSPVQAAAPTPLQPVEPMPVTPVEPMPTAASETLQAQSFEPIPSPQYDPTPSPQTEWIPEPAWESAPRFDEPTFAEAPTAEEIPEPVETPVIPPYVEAPYMPRPQRQIPSERYVRTEPPKQKKQRKARPEPTGGQKALTVLLCVLLSIVFLLMSTIGALRGLLDDDNIEYIAETAEINDLELHLDGDVYSPAECIYLAFDPELQKIFTERDIEQIIDEEETREFLAETVEDYADFLQGENRLRALDADRIMDFLHENPRVLERNASGSLMYSRSEGFSTLDSSFDTLPLDRILENALESAVDFDSLSKIGLRTMLGDGLDLIRFALSPICYILLIVLCALLLALILVVNRTNILACLGKVFVTSLILGTLLLLVLAAVLLSDYFLPTEVLSFTALISEPLARYYVLLGGVLFVGGLVGLIVYKKLRKPAPNDIS